MKKAFKSLMVGLLAIPCALAFTGCGGDGSVKVDTSGNYQSYGEFTKMRFEQDREDGAFDFQGVKFTTEQKTTSNMMVTDVKANGTAVFNDNKVEFTMTINGKRTLSMGTSTSINMTISLKDDVLYVKSDIGKFQMNPNNAQNQYGEYLRMVPTQNIIYDAASITENSEATFEEYMSDLTKYHIQDETTACWLVLDKKLAPNPEEPEIPNYVRIFKGFKRITTSSEGNSNVEQTLSMVSYTGSIKFPSFDGYQSIGL